MATVEKRREPGGVLLHGPGELAATWLSSPRRSSDALEVALAGFDDREQRRTA